MALYELQKIDSQIDEINKVKGELPLEVQDLEDEIEGLVLGEKGQCLGRRADARQGGRIRQIQVEVLAVDLRLDVTILLQDIAIVGGADQQDAMDAVFHVAMQLLALVVVFVNAHGRMRGLDNIQI